MDKASLKVFRWLICLLAVMLLNACADNVISIESEDSVTFTTLETSFPVSYTHLTLPTICFKCRSRGWAGE